MYTCINDSCTCSSVWRYATACRFGADGRQHCYFPLKQVRSRDAATACPGDSYLARIDSLDEFHFIYAYVTEGLCVFSSFVIVLIFVLIVLQIWRWATQLSMAQTNRQRRFGRSWGKTQRCRSCRGVMGIRPTGWGARTACLFRRGVHTELSTPTVISSLKPHCVKLKSRVQSIYDSKYYFNVSGNGNSSFIHMYMYITHSIHLHRSDEYRYEQ